MNKTVTVHVVVQGFLHFSKVHIAVTGFCSAYNQSLQQPFKSQNRPWGAKSLSSDFNQTRKASTIPTNHFPEVDITRIVADYHYRPVKQATQVGRLRALDSNGVLSRLCRNWLYFCIESRTGCKRQFWKKDIPP